MMYAVKIRSEPSGKMCGDDCSAIELTVVAMKRNMRRNENLIPVASGGQRGLISLPAHITQGDHSYARKT
jgi:hypothetical protein